MYIKSVKSLNSSVAGAVADIKTQLEGSDVKMLIYFASWKAYSGEEISAKMQEAFKDAVVYGCSSHAELSDGKTLTDSVAAMAFGGEVIMDAKVEVLENLSQGIDVTGAFQSFDEHFGVSMSEADYREYGGIVLMDGLSAKEEAIMDKIGTKSQIIFVGGSASDNFSFEKTYVYANGKAYTDAALLAVFQTKRGIDFIKTQSVNVKDITLTVTKADPEKREVIEFDNQPAIKRYAEVYGADLSEIDQAFFGNPLGLVIDDDVYIRNCQRRDGDSMIFYCSMPEGMELNLLAIKDIVPDTMAAVKAKEKELGKIAGLIEFRCAFRTVQLESEGKLDDYAAIFEGIPAIGFSTYGEAYLCHMNQTSTMLVFK